MATKEQREEVICNHVYNYVGSDICTDCGGHTHEPHWTEINAAHKKWVEDHPDHEYTWWSI
jgi:hypothetical protein